MMATENLTIPHFLKRHEHTTRLQNLIRELREWVPAVPHAECGAYPGHRAFTHIIADALNAIDDEMAAIDAAARDASKDKP